MSQAGARDRRRSKDSAATLAEQAGQLARVVGREPFRRRSWAELGYFLLSCALAYAGAVVLAVFGFAGVALTVCFVGVLLLGVGLRAARVLGLWQRALARRLLGEEVDEPEPFSSRPGLFGWLRAALSDRAAWRSVGYVVAKLPLTILGAWFALSIWLEALLDLASPLTGRTGHIGFGIVGNLSIAGTGPVGGSAGPATEIGAFALGFFLLIVAPWPMRLVVHLDRRLVHLLLGPDAASSRVRRLEQSRSRTLDTAAETLQRIERNLHDGTQAQLVALAMRLGQAKEKLDGLGGAGLAEGSGQTADLDVVRRLVDEAHRGAKAAITDLRDLARGIHPPALDKGLENALATLAARSAVPTELTVSLRSRPTPGIEVICYFCAAELLANVAQHAQASRASLSCAQHGPWIRIVVRDNGLGGAAVHRVDSASSGLAGLADRVGAVDGAMSIASPQGGPTAITVDLPAYP
ncbi:MAG: sensor histidine kinase [Acidimicrobiales bacterium]